MDVLSSSRDGAAGESLEMERERSRMTKESRLPVAIVLYLVTAIMASGCAGPVHMGLNPAQIDPTEQTEIRAMIETEVPSVQVANSTTFTWLGVLVGLVAGFPMAVDEAEDELNGGGGSGIKGSTIVISAGIGLGAMIDMAVESSRSSRAQKWLTPLLEQTPDVDYRKDFWEALLPTLRALPWLNVDQTDLSAQLPRKWKVGNTNLSKPKGAIPAEWLDENVLLASSDYSFTPDGRHLVVASWVQFWTEPKSKPSYFAHYIFVSEGVDAGTGEEALGKWAANGGELYRAALDAGIQETMSMIRLDLPDAEGRTEHVSGQPATIKAPNAKGKRSTFQGRLLDRREDRVILRSSRGEILSFPLRESELEVKER
jgi:hypothetical protein